MCRWAARGRGIFFSFGEGGKGPPTGRRRGSAPLGGAGRRPPFSLVLPKKTGRARSKRKTLLCPNPARSGRFGQIRESCESVRRKLGGFVPGALYLMGTGKVVPAFEGSERLSGWLSYGCCSSFRAPASLSATWEIDGAAAERGAGQIRFAPRYTETVRRGVCGCKLQKSRSRAQR